MENSTRRPYFIEEEDDGLASVAEMEAGVSSQNGVVSSPFCYTRRRSSSLRNMSHFHPQGYYYHQYSVSSPRSVVSGRFHDSRFDSSYNCSHHQPHYLDSCTLCKKPLVKIDMYMYRGDIPFCSEECRQEEIDKEEEKEKKQSLSSSVKAMRSLRKERSSSSTSSSPDYAFKPATLLAA